MIWWCEEHQASYQLEADPNPPTWGCWYTVDDHLAVYDCRMVEALLIVKENVSHDEWEDLEKRFPDA